MAQPRGNAALPDDILANLFCFLAGEIGEEPGMKTAVHPFDYALVQIRIHNVCFSITRRPGAAEGVAFAASCPARYT
jgi:hypothetical protein